MNKIMNVHKVQTMSSREIAETVQLEFKDF